MGDQRNGAAAVGNFDGVHRGHAALIAELRHAARSVNGPAVAITFDPHPIAILAPERLQPPLTAMPDRIELLKVAGADDVVVLKTTRELLYLKPLEFIKTVLVDRLAVRAVVEGFNFRFGRDRTGDNELLANWCHERGIAFSIVPAYQRHGVTVSSSCVRSALETGDAAAAAELLGRPYRLRGIVATGAKRGQLLGFPTANLEKPMTLIPAEGVYAANAWLDDGSSWPAALNIGPNPTFGEQTKKVEAHLIGFAGTLYGQGIALDLIARLRATRRFGSIDELKAQLAVDTQLAASLVARG